MPLKTGIPVLQGGEDVKNKPHHPRTSGVFSFRPGRQHQSKVGSMTVSFCRHVCKLSSAFSE